MIIKWLLNNNYKQLVYGILFVFTSFIGGFMVSDLPPKFIELFTTYIGQFVVFLILNFFRVGIEGDINILFILIESILCVMVFNIIKYIINIFFKQ